jgi:DNA mismatch repair ATPase MutL
MARSLAIKSGDKLQPEEMHAIIDDLFACPLPEQGLDGKACLRILKEDELNQSFD